MREIVLSQGKIAIVDDEDYDWLSQWSWYYRRDNTGRKDGKKYDRAVRSVRIGSSKMNHSYELYMHREIMKAGPDQKVDHVNGDGLDMRRSNLRFYEKGQNRQNSDKNSHYRGNPTSSPFKGVTWHKATGKWAAACMNNGKRKHLGLFHLEEEAAHAYDAAAREMHGEFARLNFP